MSIFGKYNLAFLLIIYSVIINLIYNSYFVNLSIILVVFVYLFINFKSAKLTMLFPFFLYPFMFLIRAQDPESIILIILPEVFTILAIVVHIFRISVMTSHVKFFLLLGAYAVITLLIDMFHVGEISYLPLILRQYILPVVFLIVFINASERNNRLAIDALKISVISFAVVGIITLLNITEIVSVEPSTEALYPFLHYEVGGDNSKFYGRNLTEDISMSRINLFTGGALGSSAAIFFALGLIPFFLSKNESNWRYKALSVVLLVPSLMTLSTSVVIAVAWVLLVVVGTSKRAIYFSPFVFIILFFLLTTELFIDKSPLDYVSDSSISGLLIYINSIDLTAFLIGSGPRLVSQGYEFVPELFVTDVGIFRVFVETGLVNFILFLGLLFVVLRRGLVVLNAPAGYNVKPFLILFLLFISLLHANMSALPPFFPLFSAIVAGIFCAYSGVRRNI